MAKVKVKKMKMPAGAKDKDLADLFNSMLGCGNVNMSIAYPRYLCIKGLTEQLIKLFEMFNSGPFMQTYKEFATEQSEIESFCKQGRTDHAKMFAMDFSDYEWNLN